MFVPKAHCLFMSSLDMFGVSVSSPEGAALTLRSPPSEHDTSLQRHRFNVQSVCTEALNQSTRWQPACTLANLMIQPCTLVRPHSLRLRTTAVTAMFKETKQTIGAVLPLEHSLHILNLLAGELFELGVRVEDPGRSWCSVALVDVQPTRQFGG